MSAYNISEVKCQFKFCASLSGDSKDPFTLSSCNGFIDDGYYAWKFDPDLVL